MTYLSIARERAQRALTEDLVVHPGWVARAADGSGHVEGFRYAYAGYDTETGEGYFIYVGPAFPAGGEADALAKIREFAQAGAA